MALALSAHVNARHTNWKKVQPQVQSYRLMADLYHKTHSSRFKFTDSIKLL